MKMMKTKLNIDHIFVPAKVESKKLMVVLHGRGDSAEGLSFLPSVLNIPDMNYLLLNAPDDYYGGYSWYDLPPDQLSGILRSRTLLEETFDALFSEEFAPQTTSMFGFSQGSLMCFEFGSRYKHTLAGYIALSGYIFDPKAILKEFNPKNNHGKWFVSHGYEDDVLPFSQSKSELDILEESGFKFDFFAYHKPHTVLEEELSDIKRWLASIMG
jgi:phospholipase/carboxylesterase